MREEAQKIIDAFDTEGKVIVTVFEAIEVIRELLNESEGESVTQGR